MRLRAATATLAALAAQCALASTASDQPLSLADVLESSRLHYPGIRAAVAKQRIAGNEAMAAAGGFDTQLSSEGLGWLGGFYDGAVVTNKVYQPFQPMGANVFAQYKLANGDFPIYQDSNFTNTGGQAKLGVAFSLLRDRDIDDRRFALLDADLALVEADLALVIKQLEVQQNAAIRYWQWVAAGQRLGVYRDLLNIAVARETGLTEQVERGAQARINLLENRQVITRRQTLIASAEREFKVAATRLSLYYRDDNGTTLVARDAQLPQGVLRGPEGLGASAAATDTSKTLIENRPELLAVENRIERALNRVRLRENSVKPRLDLSLEVSDGLGAIAEGGPSRDTFDTIVGVNFSVPLQQRSARARLAQSRLTLDALAAERDEMTDMLLQELRELAVERRFALTLARLAEAEVAQSRELQEAELRRFQQGASDFFLINVREQALANAQIKALGAWLQFRLADVRYQAVTLNLPELGLPASSLPTG